MPPAGKRKTLTLREHQEASVTLAAITAQVSALLDRVDGTYGKTSKVTRSLKQLHHGVAAVRSELDACLARDAASPEWSDEDRRIVGRLGPEIYYGNRRVVGADHMPGVQPEPKEE
jgi:hypothetical protein